MTLSSNLGGRELKLIASSFVKQYYTLLNKAPCYIHNFYNHDSTFIHGTIEMGSDNHTEPVVGREKIEEKMRDLQLNDCRAKIKQIDCLETLSGGLVLQVIGELSNDGKPMRRFLQTFVLAPSPDQSRHDGDSETQNKANDSRRGVQISENSANSSHNQKFYVLNSIFRYQDDGTDSEFEDESASVKANTSVDTGAEQSENDDHNIKVKAAPTAQLHAHQQAHQEHKMAASVEQPKNSPKSSTPSEPAPSSEQHRRTDVKVHASNGTANAARKSEVSEKVSNENGKDDNQQKLAPTPAPTNSVVETSTTPAVASQNSSTAHPATSSTAAPVNAAPRPSNEPKTWANMVRNAISPLVAPPTSGGPPIKEQSLNQSNQAQNQPQQQQIPHQHHQQQQQQQQQQPQHQQQQQQQQLQQQQQQQPQQQQQQQSSQSPNEQQQNNNSNNNSNPNRRRHMIKKTSNNKPGNVNGSVGGSGSGTGRPMKYKPPRPAAATTSKPAA